MRLNKPMKMLRQFSALSLAWALATAAAFVPAHAEPKTNGLTVTVPNGYATVSVEDLSVRSTAGPVRWMRIWDGQEWKFNPQWESLSQSWANLTGSQTADTMLGTTSSGGGAAGTAGAQLLSGGGGGGGGDGGCWVWVDENWQPSRGTALIGGIPEAGPMLPVRTTPFNRMMGESSQDYPPPQRVSVDYASLCGGLIGSGSVVRDMEGIRRANELYLGEGGRYAFSNRAVLEKRAIRQLPSASAANLYASLAAGRITLAPAVNEKGFRWIDKGGDWIDYDTQGRVAAWGDKNDNILWMLRDTEGVLRGVVDANGRVVYSLHYSGDLITEVRDYAASADGQAHSIKYKYDTLHRLTEVTDARGNLWKYGYDAANRIIQLTDPEGRIEKLEYSGDMVKKRTAPDGAVTDYKFEYDDTNKQFASKITGPETTAGRRVEEFTHNRVGKLVRAIVNGRTDLEVRYDTGARTRIETNARGFTTRITNNEFDQVVDIAYGDGATVKRKYSPQHLGIVEKIDELGFKTQYQYDAKGNVVARIEAAQTSRPTITEYVRNNFGQVVQSIRKGGAEANGVITPDAAWAIEYDELGQIKKTTDPEGHVRQYSYDHAGNLLSFTNPRGFTTRYEVDADGNLTKATDALNRVRTYEYDKVGNLTVITDARAKKVQAAYDAMNRHLQSINAVGGVYKVQYNGQGLPVSETDEDGRTSIAEFDNFLRLSKQIDGMGNVTEYSYNIPDGSNAGTLGALHDPTEIKYPTFTQRNRYDQQERPTSETKLNPTSTGIEGLVSGTVYDKRGQVTSETDAYGKTRLFAYDALGQLVETTDSLGNKTKVLHDLRGNLIQITDAKGNVNKFEFDRNNYVVKETLPLGQVTTYKYDAAGNLKERVSPTGSKVVLAYDAGNRISEVKQYNAGEVLLRTTTYAWDNADNLTGWTDTDHALAKTSSATSVFDDNNRKTAETVTYPGGFAMSYGYAYSLAGGKTQIAWPDGTLLGYRYSAHGELDSVAIPGEGSISVTEYKWVAPAKTVLPGGISQERSFDGLLNLEALRVKTPGNQTVLDLASTYGKVEELKTSSRTDTIGGISSTVQSAYNYDDATQLTSVSSSVDGASIATESYTLDALGNRVAHSRVSGAWTYDANNRLVQRGTGANATTYEYDESGNLTKRVEPGAKITLFEYDARDRLTHVRDGNNKLVARYGYDPLDRRIYKEQFRNRDGSLLAPAKRTFYLYADEGLIAEASQDIVLQADQTVTDSGAPVITAQYGVRPDADFNVATLFIKTRNTSGQQVFAYYHHDRIGTPIQATDKAGNVVWAANYNAFGQATIITPEATPEFATISSSLRLPGQVEDPETGLHYNFRRYYDPSTGRYITQDPIGIEGGNNPYRYAESDPVNLSDPSGECPMCVGYAVCVAQCMAEDVATNAAFGECNNFGDSAKSCAASCLLGPLGRMGKWAKKAANWWKNRPPPTCPINSFPGSTLVHVKPAAAGPAEARQAKAELKPISSIQVGDEVLARSEWKTGTDKDSGDIALSYERVTDVFTSFRSQKLVHLTLDDGETLTATEGHPFQTADGWRDAIVLKKGNRLVGTGKPGKPDPQRTRKIVNIRTEIATLKVFNLEVANAHTYLVGEDGAVVHNGFGSYTCYFKSGKRYHGKGDAKRAQKSAEREAKRNNDTIDRVDHKPEANDYDSFKSEAERIRNDGGIENPDNYNRINSPGKKYL